MRLRYKRHFATIETHTVTKVTILLFVGCSDEFTAAPKRSRAAWDYVRATADGVGICATGRYERCETIRGSERGTRYWCSKEKKRTVKRGSEDERKMTLSSFSSSSLSFLDLYEHLHSQTLSDADFSWPLRVRIARDVSKGLRYLHQLTPPIIHRDLRSPNIFVR